MRSARLSPEPSTSECREAGRFSPVKAATVTKANRPARHRKRTNNTGGPDQVNAETALRHDPAEP
jgi:hypothetical protein